MSGSASNTSGTGRVIIPRLLRPPINEMSSSDSDSDDNRLPHSGGAKLNQSPYRPPQVRAAKSKDQMAVPTPETTDSEVVPMTQAMQNLSFQQGSPSGTELFAELSSNDSTGPVANDSDDETEGHTPKTMGKARADASYPPTTQASTSATPGARSIQSRRSDRHLVGEFDAQHVYNHTSCVFIANLPSGKDDMALEAEILRQFREFGTMFIKIKRDERDMPFGFLQFTNDEDAAKAIAEGRGKRIFERACRVEPAKANRTFLVWRRDAREITVAEAMKVVAQDGEVSTAFVAGDDIVGPMRVNSAVYVEFTYFDCDRDLVHRYRGDRTYVVRPYDPNRAFRDPGVDYTDQAYLSEYEMSRLTVWVGNLPSNITEAKLRELFETSGDVSNMQLIRRDMAFGKTRTFAFVTFSRADMPDIAVAQWHGRAAFGVVLRVERKNDAPAKTVRRVRSTFATKEEHGPTTPYQSPASAGRAVARRSFTTFGGVNSEAAPYLAAQAAMTPTTQPGPIIVSSAGNTPSLVAEAPLSSTAPTTASLARGSRLSATAEPFIPAVSAPAPLLNTMPGSFPTQFYNPTFMQPGFYGNHFGFNMTQQQTGNPNYGAPYIDPVSGMMYAAPPMMPSAYVGMPGFGQQRNASAMPTFSAPAPSPTYIDQAVERLAQVSLKEKKSVTFADPVVTPGNNGGTNTSDSSKPGKPRAGNEPGADEDDN